VKPDDARQDQQTLRDEFDAPQSVHATVYARLADCFGIEVYQRRGVTRREYAHALADLLREQPHLADLFNQRKSIRTALAVAATVERNR
jgi:hypothetical protein